MFADASTWTVLSTTITCNASLSKTHASDPSDGTERHHHIGAPSSVMPGFETAPFETDKQLPGLTSRLGSAAEGSPEESDDIGVL
jgi:hypothetical protein